MSQKNSHQHTHPEKQELLPFKVTDLVGGSITDFDLYTETGKTMALYAKSPYHWTQEEIVRLAGAGQGTLFYVTRDCHRVEAYQLSRIDMNPGAGLPPPERILRITDAASELTRILYQYQLTASSLARVRSLAQALVTCVEEDPTCIAALGKLAHHDFYTYFHSARVSAHAVAIAVWLGLSDSHQLLDLATGALVHDIGKSQISLDILNKPGSLGVEEWAVIKKHPEWGAELVQHSQLSMIPRSIILSHHERFDGSGYPHQLAERELLEEVKIAAFADTFDALTTNRPYQTSRSPFEALDFIKQRLLKNLHQDSYRAMVELLAEAQHRNQVSA